MPQQRPKGTVLGSVASERVSGRVSFGIRLTAVNLSAVSDKEAVLTSEEMVEEQAAVEEVVEEEEEEDGAVAGGEGEALRSLLEVGNFWGSCAQIS